MGTEGVVSWWGEGKGGRRMACSPGQGPREGPQRPTRAGGKLALSEPRLAVGCVGTLDPDLSVSCGSVGMIVVFWFPELKSALFSTPCGRWARVSEAGRKGPVTLQDVCFAPTSRFSGFGGYVCVPYLPKLAQKPGPGTHPLSGCQVGSILHTNSAPR